MINCHTITKSGHYCHTITKSGHYCHTKTTQ